MKPPMDANERELILKEEVYAVVGCAIEVLRRRAHGSFASSSPSLASIRVYSRLIIEMLRREIT